MPSQQERDSPAQQACCAGYRVYPAHARAVLHMVLSTPLLVESRIVSRCLSMIRLDDRGIPRYNGRARATLGSESAACPMLKEGFFWKDIRM